MFVENLHAYAHSGREDVVLRIGNKIATTRDIQCLCPDREIEDKVKQWSYAKCDVLSSHNG